MGNVNELNKLRGQAHTRVSLGKKFTHSFTLNFKEIRPDFVGDFIVHRPSQVERLQIGIIKSSLLNGLYNVDLITDNIAHICATLQVVADKLPDWFNIDDPELEYEILDAAYVNYINWVNSFRPSVKTGQDEGDSETTTG